MKGFWNTVRLLGVLAGILVYSAGFAEIDVNGLLRNDMYLSRTTNNEFLVSDILEQRLVLNRNTDSWKFYADLRLYLYYGGAAEALVKSGMSTLPLITGTPLPVSADSLISLFGLNEFMDVNLLRAFIRYYAPYGQLSIGKTYVNFGVSGVFNPFEMSKSVNTSDLSYDKDGLLAVYYEAPLGSTGGFKVYMHPESQLSNTGCGFSIYGNLLGFDMGLVLNRKEYSRNVVGVYTKGDLEVGIEVSWAFHFDDYWTNNFNEAKIGVDYSFFEGRMIVSGAFYYTENGATETNDYDSLSTADKYFQAKYYAYGNITFAPDEFWQFQLNGFVNAIDASTLIVLGVNHVLANGLNIGGQFSYVWGEKDEEFSRDQLGEYSLLFRFEAKL